MPSSDFKGETLYLRIHTANGYRIFSPLFVPALDPLDRFKCRIGLWYTRFISEFLGLRSDVTIFVPRREPREIGDIRITNLSDEPLEVGAIPLVEYSHPDALQQFTNRHWSSRFIARRNVCVGFRTRRGSGFHPLALRCTCELSPAL
jgi:cellobiose phosphorylase